MATITAVMIFGPEHLYDGGLSGAFHGNVFVRLSENSRPSWTINPNAYFRRQNIATPFSRKFRYTLVPSLESTLEDGLLLTALVLMHQQQWGQAAQDLQRTLSEDGRLEIYAFPKDVCEEARKEVREHSGHLPKMVLSVLEFDALIHEQIASLRHYSHKMSVCMPIFTRKSSGWSDKNEEKGALPELAQPMQTSFFS